MRESTSLVDLSCSGDMYDGDPMMVAVAVSVFCPRVSGTVAVQVPPEIVAVPRFPLPEMPLKTAPLWSPCRYNYASDTPPIGVSSITSIRTGAAASIRAQLSPRC